MQAVFLKKVEHLKKTSRKNRLKVDAGFYTKADMAKELGWSKPGP